ncbi:MULTISPECIES: orotidine-5'-phosphate decarboxylase [Methanosphaera]|uniref:Orotidine 5'-phosphate decarboxylase n=1 Tax=Methanosphaera stadtmanae (strain ATCC 43021 / DSM 3091 / JCM 11832 / MCB-3) TaxID=339860 RepID=PYRF_METST|nr:MULTISPECIES: orotidine-5'-phosphate decarboxylase [Methanosphaera]Q2NHA5.1 RecName: Full=Orotidine 5'-phosphate decarboxylase; AltName: Full=OMP decarboxylase; Short=OMPDCase; Short=OMPdecase [Methanosphaera stadtmanae DSM 3091]ABC56798.1 PyrF [Methanosphaera stadtmanae DSM 3091]MEE0489712.1 orotidine-5'-phosphate decarboxylase [Methanosphaera stadtmanae]OEC92015.1 orotidine 5'-phosphate decarboxylase [Methanosphaera sp. A6]
MNVKNQIILALDVEEKNKAYEILDQTTEYLDTIKIGYPITLALGPSIITSIKEEYDVKIIADFKVADIDATNEKIVKTTLNYGADAIIVHGFTGEDSVLACKNMAEKLDKEIFLLTEMSHPGADKFLKPVSLDIAQMGVDLGIKNYVAPATKIDRLKKIREVVGKDSFIISPGVGFQGGNAKDTLQYSNAAIVGRSIYNASNPKKALEEIIESIKV